MAGTTAAMSNTGHGLLAPLIAPSAGLSESKFLSFSQISRR
jgi:hypothetical protein